MTARKTPALYELMGGEEGRRRRAAPEPPEDEPGPLRWLGAGRAVRLPVGYIWLTAAVVLALLVGAFSVGFVRGRHEAEAEFQESWLAMNPFPAPPPEVGGQDPVASAPAERPPAALPAPAAEAGTPAEWGPLVSDPRQAGVNYFVLIATYKENAVKVGEFFRAHEVEAYVIGTAGSQLYRVIVLPGYVRGERDTERVRALERQIVDVARRWGLEMNPRDNLAYYPELYKG